MKKLSTEAMIKNYAAGIVSAALRHDFGIPLGTIGSNAQYIIELDSENHDLGLGSKTRGQLVTIAKQISDLADELYDEFPELGRKLPLAREFERMRHYNNVKKRVAPSLTELHRLSELIERYSINSNDKEVRIMCSQINDQSKLANSMFSGIRFFLQIGDISDDNFTLIDADRDIKPISKAVINDFRFRRGNLANITISGSAKIMCIKNHFNQLMQNIISNAVKFSSSSDRPTVKVELETMYFQDLQSMYRDRFFGLTGTGVWAKIVVIDNGDGFEISNSKSIFKLHFTKSQKQVNISGSGIGLALSNLIVLLHGGVLFAKVDSGLTKFFILLPCERRGRLDTTAILAQSIFE